MAHAVEHHASKVPEVTLGLWIVKILATTLGETGGDTVTMTMDFGYLTGTAIFLSALAVLAVVQIAAKKFHPLLYWSVIVASTTAGTTLADFATRSFGDRIFGRVALAVRLPDGRARPMVFVGRLHFRGDGQRAQGGSLLLGGDHVLADLGNRARRLDRRRTWIWRSGAGFLRRTGGATAAYYWTNVSRVTLFWVAFILTRPLGATVGDFLDKPLDHGGLA